MNGLIEKLKLNGAENLATALNENDKNNTAIKFTGWILVKNRE